jgi:hypothetical protein
MISRMSNWINHISNSWVALSTLIIFLLFIALVLPGQALMVEENVGDTGSPDMSFYYSADDLYQRADAYGEEGRRSYIKERFTFDLIWPLVYTMFLSMGISWVFTRAFTASSLWQRANLAPVVGAVFDYLENVSTSLVMARYPNATAILDVLAGVFTLVKWGFIIGSFLFLIVGLAVGIWQWLRKLAGERNS